MYNNVFIVAELLCTIEYTLSIFLQEAVKHNNE